MLLDPSGPRADASGPLETALRLTAIGLLLRPMGPWAIRPLILVAAVIALIFSRAVRSPLMWGALAGLIASRIVVDWPLPDNHIYLLAYWSFAVALALGAADPAKTLGLSCRLLLGLAFLMAVLWKVALSPDYVDGRFFRVTLRTDLRFSDAVRLIGGVSEEEIDRDREYLRPLPEGAAPADPPRLIEPRAFTRLAWFSTWGLLLVEALVALACLAPLRGRALLVRHALLLLFCVVTYAFAPVAGFGWVILAMGLALCPPSQRLLHATYVIAWFLVLLYAEVPWAGVMADWVGSG